MHEEKYAAIAQYLAEHVDNLGIEQEHDFDLGAQSFKVQIPNNSLLFKVADPFVDDFSAPEIVQRLNNWNIATVLSQNRNRIVLLGNEGVQLLPRE